MADHAKAEALVLPGIFQRMLGRPSHGNTAEDKRTGAVSSLGFMASAAFLGLSNGVELFNPPPSDAALFRVIIYLTNQAFPATILSERKCYERKTENASTSHSILFG